MIDKIELKQLRDFGAIIGDTFVFIKQNIGALLKCFFSICGLFMLAGVVGMVLKQMQEASIADAYGYNGGGGFFMLRQTIFSWEYLFIVVINILTQASANIVVLSYVALYIKKGNEAPLLEEVWSYYKFFILRVFGSTIGIFIFMVLAFMLCILPGIYIFPAMMIFFPIMILENASFSFSFERSFKLLKDEWWSTAAVVLVLFVIFYMCSLIFQMPAIVVEQLGTITHTTSELKQVYQIGAAIFSQLAEVFAIIPIVGGALIYFHLVEKKESAGLLERIETFGQHDNQSNQLPEEY